MRLSTRGILIRFFSMLSLIAALNTSGYAAERPRAIMWDDLISTAFSLEMAPTNEALNEQYVRLPGYVVPLEMDGELVAEFLLVPYAGACIHTPPPPANQIVHVIAKEPFKGGLHRQAVWAKGLMKVETQTSSVGYYSATAGYKLVDAEVELYDQ